MIAATVILFLITGFFNGVMDHLQFHDSGDNPVNTWKNKYKKDSEGNPIKPTKAPWYYFGFYAPVYVEAFPFSSTLLVSITDPWHRYKMLCFTSVRTALILVFATYTNYNTITYIGTWIGLWAVQALGFHIRYTWIK